MGIRRNTKEENSLPTLAANLGYHHVEDVNIDEIEVDLIRNIPLSLAREQKFLPLWHAEEGLVVAICDPFRNDIISDISLYFKTPILPILMDEEKLLVLINETYDKSAQSASAVMQEMEQDGVLDDEEEIYVGEDLLDNPQAAPMVRFVNSLLSQAIKQKASDIHIEPFEKDLSVRLRVDGVLQEDVQPPKGWKEQLVSRIKVMANLDIAKKNIPQDGRIRTRMAGREVDIRVSTLPVRHGERVVMRLLEKKSEFSMSVLGMNPVTLDSFRNLITSPYGIILVCGPTGSGKTTTLYSALSEINSPDKNILTIEDPIEYELRGIGQTQVVPKIGLTFGRVIRAHLRQDPDVILVGETRDQETAENAIQASLTGHLVFTTIHTNDAATAFTRLIDMGIEPFLVATSVIAILAQRLIRKLCPECKTPYTPTEEEIMRIGLDPSQVTKPFYRAKGCSECNHNGYRGRMGIYELLEVNEDIRRSVASGKDSATIKKVAVRHGMKTLRNDGNLKVLEGLTSVEEILRVTAEEQG